MKSLIERIEILEESIFDSPVLVVITQDVLDQKEVYGKLYKYVTKNLKRFYSDSTEKLEVEATFVLNREHGYPYIVIRRKNKKDFDSIDIIKDALKHFGLKIIREIKTLDSYTIEFR